MDQHTKESIDKIVFDNLRNSKSLDVFPTPVDKIVQYCELDLKHKNDFHHFSSNYVPKKLDDFKRMMKKVLGVFDRENKSIYIDPSLPTTKKSFIKLHETGHDALPWQRDVLYLDDKMTLSIDAKEEFEIEANYFASSCLFQLDRFDDEINKLPLEITSAMVVAKKFGGSNHAALRRYVDNSRKKCSLLVLEYPEKKELNPVLNLRNVFQSKLFSKEFGILNWPKTFDATYPFVDDYLLRKTLHKEGYMPIEFQGNRIELNYHYFNNTYNVFVFVFPLGEKISSKTKIYVTSKLPS